MTMVNTRLRRDEPIPVPQHTSTEAPDISDAVPVPDSTFNTPQIYDLSSVVCFDIEVRVASLVQWLVRASLTAGVLLIWHILR
ncbi:hypothetical protein BPOR_0039g00010 [Botrytis porri]|uniref:Uncharacterized protein n=1 Tax=Botrytis porri TaxID=87229 RepID=A0A4Z1L330_9HELO|nr:hypothetical protein BPOR_0039g00010 [Botrytis porri]